MLLEQRVLYDYSIRYYRDLSYNGKLCRYRHMISKVFEGVIFKNNIVYDIIS